MQKYRDHEIKSFEFSDLKGTHVIAQEKFEAFSFQSLDGKVQASERPTEESIREERGFESKNNFRIDELVRNYRGLSKQEQSDLELKIQAEVKKRLEASYKEAYAEGLEKGRQEGKKEAFEKFQEELVQKVEDFSAVISALQEQTGNLVLKNRREIHDFVKRFTKWIVLKEINDKVYLENLLEKLILELNEKRNLIVKVGRANFAQMPEVIQTIEARLGQLTNVRVEIVPELNDPGIILESQNALIDGSLDGVFQNIDKIFEQVVGHE